MSGRYIANIIGAGSIGALKDIEVPGGKDILTMAHACYAHPDIELEWIIEIDKEKASKAAEKWDCLGANRIFQKADIYIVCTPEENHYKQLKYIIKDCEPKVVVCEKPFCSSIEEAEEIVHLYQEKDIPLIVDYTRQFSTGHRQLIESLQNNEFGEVYSCRLYYNRGLYRDGCHFINLCFSLFGKFDNGYIVDNGRIVIDYSEKDYTPTVHLQFEKCKNIFMLPCDGRKYDIFEIEIMTEKGKILLTEHGQRMKVFGTEKEDTYSKDYSMLSPDPICFNMELTTALYNVVDNAVNVIEGKQNPFCSGYDALKTQIVIESIRSTL